jgi:hypothetical protein
MKLTGGNYPAPLKIIDVVKAGKIKSPHYRCIAAAFSPYIPTICSRFSLGSICVRCRFFLAAVAVVVVVCLWRITAVFPFY